MNKTRTNPSRRSGWRCPGLKRLALAAWLWATAATASVAFAQDAAEDYIEPRIGRQHFMALCQLLQLGKDQRLIIETAFGDYTANLTELARDLDDKADKLGRQRVRDALAGKVRLAPDELVRLRVAVLNVYQQAWPEIDYAMENLLGSIESMLNAEQMERFEQGVRELRREVLLHPRQAESAFQEYAGDGVDVILLAQSALQEGGELHSVGSAALEDVLAAYERQLDAILIDSAPAYRRGKLMRKIAAIEKDSAAIRREEQAALAQWQRLYHLNEATMRRIGEIAAAMAGEEARQRWLDRFDQASFTWLYPRKRPDRQIEWMRQQNLSDEVLQQAETIYQSYLANRKALSRQAIEVMVRGRNEFQMMLYSMMEPPGLDDRTRRALYEELLKNTGELTNLESSTVASLEALLTDAQRRTLRDVLKSPDPATRRR